MRTSAILLGFATLVQVGCTKPPEATADSAMSAATPSVAAAADSAASRPITDRDWELVAMGAMASAPTGGGGKPPTLQLDAASTRASGFAGCNRYSGPYTLTSDSLSFGALMSTKMSCQDGDAIERSYLAMLAAVRTWQATDSTLTLSAAGATLATFRAR
ncbi:MAG: META domain-containing protein [Cytophagaceae bacterium]|nr:META domain-containing protein [Gemmatimonadaceae bacterium]